MLTDTHIDCHLALWNFKAAREEGLFKNYLAMVYSFFQAHKFHADPEMGHVLLATSG